MKIVGGSASVGARNFGSEGSDASNSITRALMGMSASGAPANTNEKPAARSAAIVLSEFATGFDASHCTKRSAMYEPDLSCLIDADGARHAPRYLPLHL
jgi:hypothetical protein